MFLSTNLFWGLLSTIFTVLIDGLHDAAHKIIVLFPNVPGTLMGDFSYPSTVWSVVPPHRMNAPFVEHVLGF